MSKVINSPRIWRQTQVSWLQGHYFSCIISSFWAAFSGFHGESRAVREDWRNRREMAHLTLTDKCIMLIATLFGFHGILLCLPACLGLFLLLSLRDESWLSHPQPRIASPLVDYILLKDPSTCLLTFHSQVWHKITVSSYNRHLKMATNMYK